MQEKVETPNTQLQKVTLLVAMQDYDENSFNAGEWLENVLSSCADNRANAPYAAKCYARAMQIVKVENCEVVVTNVVE